MNREALIELGTKAVMEHRQAKGGDAYPPIYHAEEEVTAALTAITEAGMVVVPREPTEGMIAAGKEQMSKAWDFDFSKTPESETPKVYKAMLAAAEKGKTQ